ncbi:MAG: PD-(D/E)XK nuclease family protein [Clostridia bacterium]|nr:PD-(D/E)XK nuclease family protein [Clostridia bacterium]
MLNFIFGRACTGKSYTVIKKAARDSLNGQVVIIVPEQFTFETERALIKIKERRNDNITVLSFTRLFDEISNTVGKGSVPCISEFEKIIFTDKALRATAENLTVFSKYIGFPDFVKKLAALIKDFKFASATPDAIFSASEEIGGSCGAKLKDLSIVMSAYDALISDKFIDPSDFMTRLYETLRDFQYFKGKSVYFDAFTGFTEQQYKVIERIIEQSQDVTFSFATDDYKSEDINVFYNINSAIRKIKSIAASRGVKENEPLILDTFHYNNPNLKELECLMVGEKTEEAFNSDGIRLISCKNPREEAVATATLIKNEVRQNNYRYRDFIVVSRNMETYKNFIELQCKKNEVACFTDRSVRLIDTPLYVHISALFELVISFSEENIFKYLKSGLVDIPDEDVFTLEDYIYVWSIKGSDWANEWVMSPRGLETGEDGAEEQKKLAKINELREKVYNSIIDFRKRFSGTPTNMSKALFGFLEKQSIDKLLASLCDRFEEDGDRYSASILRQSWDVIIGIMDSIVRVFEDKEIKTEEYVSAFNLAAESIEISNVPQMLDEVTFGSADRIRPSKPKIAFILGANQDVFPNTKLTPGLLSEQDKKKLKNANINLNDDAIKSAVEEDYLVYSLLCCAVDKVYIMYSQGDMTGAKIEPSAFISRITNHFTSLKEEKFELSVKGDFIPQTPKVAFGDLSLIAQDNKPTVKASLEGIEPFDFGLSVINSARDEQNFSISPTTAKELFGKDIYISASKLDKYYSCKLKYFLDSGLKTGKVKKADLNVMHRGTITHYILESIINKYHKDIISLSQEELSKEVDFFIDEYFASIKGTEILLTPRFKFLLSRISQSVKDVVYHMAEDFRQNDFDPKYCEFSIGYKDDETKVVLPLEEGNVILTGKIDRVDTYKNFVRVVDYKTNSKQFDLPDVLVGLNLQMLVYLYAVVKKGNLTEDSKAAGILYMPAKSNLVKKPLAMNGLISSEEEVRDAMEKENEGKFVPKYKENSPSYADDELFELIFNKIESLMIDMAKGVKAGQFDADPMDGVNSDACKYCDYSNVCKRSDKQHKKVPKLTPYEVKEILKGGEYNGI